MPRTRLPSLLPILIPWLLVGCPGDEPVDALPGSGTDTTDSGADTTDSGEDTTASADSSTGGGGACVPGQSIACTCTGADVGVQICLSDGSGYGPCECEAADDTTSTGETEGTDTNGICGDGVTDPGEGCDDGMESAACNDDCTVAACGDGVVNATAGELCDEGGPTAACDDDCTPVECGDGLVNRHAGEACDDGGESAGCNSDCSMAACGDGIVNSTAAEACDDGGESAACNGDCSLASCGDSVVNFTAGEACDDGGESAACNVDCTVSSCGDGVFNATAGELCDEGGPTALCDGDCSLASCGDGLLNLAAGEACDDGGESVTCNADCSPTVCGDGITNATAGEACDDMGESLSCNVDCSPSACGDGLTNATAGESCDDAGESTVCDVDCTLATCGDAHVNATAGEACDEDDLAGATCQTFGFTGGTLACAQGCSTYDTTSCADLPGVPVLDLSFSAVKQFDFSWAAVADADYYQLEQSVAPGEPFVPLGGDVLGTSISHTMPLHFRYEASYRLRACNIAGCTDSAVVDVVGSLAEAVGYVKASNPDENDFFGWSLALSADGNTLAVGARVEDGSATGIDGNQASNAAIDSGAVYVFVRDGTGGWSQQAYVKASNTDAGDHFGDVLALSGDGDTLAVGALLEDGNAAGIDGDQANDSLSGSGAAYVFVRDGVGTWSQQAYVKASNPDSGDVFGRSLALSHDGDTLAVGATDEDSSATGIDGNQANDATSNSGAAYVFVRDGVGMWSQQAYVKASNTGAFDRFGYSVALSGDGDTLAVGAVAERSGATGIDGNQADDSVVNAGAVYVFVRDGVGTWSQQAYVKASNTGESDHFGNPLVLSASGDTLAVGVPLEDSGATGIDGNQADDSVGNSGAVYVFVRDGMGQWSQQAYVKASNTDDFEQFGHGVALSGDGDVLAVGAFQEDGNAIAIDGDQTNDLAIDTGAVYVFVRDGVGAWSQRTYAKAPNPDQSDSFGWEVALSGDGSTLAVGAYNEDGSATGIDGDQTDDATSSAGAVYLY